MASRILKFLFRNWSLERKSLLFIGLSLLISICAAFWFVQSLADRLVKVTTRQVASDYANMSIAWTHVERGILNTANSPTIPVFGHGGLRKYLLDNPAYKTQILMLDPVSEHLSLDEAREPSTPQEREILEELRDLQKKQIQEAKEKELASVQGDSPGPSPSEKAELEYKLYARDSPNQRKLFAELGPVYKARCARGWLLRLLSPNQLSLGLYGMPRR